MSVNDYNLKPAVNKLSNNMFEGATSKLINFDNLISLNDIFDEIKSLKDDITSLNRKIDMIFGNHALLNGRFVNLNYNK